MLLCPIWYSHSVLSALFVTFIFFWASLNGATYYIDIFGKRFQKQLLELQAEVADWKDKDEANHAKPENDSDGKPENDSDEKPENDSDEKSEHDSDEKSEHDNNAKPEHDSETKLDKDVKEKTK